MSYYTPNMAKTSTAGDARSSALGLQVDPRTPTRIPPMLRLHAAERQEQSKGPSTRTRHATCNVINRQHATATDNGQVGSRRHATFDRNSYAIVNDMSAHRSDFFKRHEGVQVRQRIPRLSARLHA